MACGKDHRSPESLARIRRDAAYFVTLHQQGIHAGLEVHLAATLQDGVPHVLDDTRQLIRTNVRVGIHQDGRRRAVLAEHVQNLVHIAPLLAAGIKLAVGVSACAPFAKAVVRLRVDGLRTAYLRQVFLAGMHILAPLHHHGAQAQFYQPEGGKQPAGTCPHHNHRGAAFYIII